MYVDTHTHIYLKDFDDDRKQIINECKKLGVTKLLLPNIDSNSMEDVIKISNEFKGMCFPMVGLHPCSWCNCRPMSLIIVTSKL